MCVLNSKYIAWTAGREHMCTVFLFITLTWIYVALTCNAQLMTHNVQ